MAASAERSTSIHRYSTRGYDLSNVLAGQPSSKFRPVRYLGPAIAGYGDPRQRPKSAEPGQLPLGKLPAPQLDEFDRGLAIDRSFHKGAHLGVTERLRGLL